MTMIWNAILTMAIGGFLWWIRSTSAAISKVKDELAKSKEQHGTKLMLQKKM